MAYAHYVLITKNKAPIPIFNKYMGLFKITPVQASIMSSP